MVGAPAVWGSLCLAELAGERKGMGWLQIPDSPFFITMLHFLEQMFCHWPSALRTVSRVLKWLFFLFHETGKLSVAVVIAVSIAGC